MIGTNKCQLLKAACTQHTFFHSPRVPAIVKCMKIGTNLLFVIKRCTLLR